MPEKPYSIHNFKGVDFRNAAGLEHGKLTDLINFVPHPDGYLQVRGGWNKPTFIGGGWDASSPIVTGSTTSKIVGAQDHRSTYPVVVTRTAGGTYSEDLSNLAYMPMFTAAAATERFCIGSPSTFSSLTLYIGRAGVNLPITWYYTRPGGLTVLSGVTEQFTSTGEKTISFIPPTSPEWGGEFFNGYFGFWIIAEVGTPGGGPIIPYIAKQKVTYDGQSRNTLIIASSDASVSTTSMKVWRYGPDGVNTRFLGVDTLGLLTQLDAPVRFATNNGVLYFVNGNTMRRYQGDPTLNANIGFTKPSSTGFNVATGAAGLLNGFFNYAISYGYGPAGEWGESTPLVWTGTIPNPINTKVDVTFPTEVATISRGIVDVIYIYRTQDMTGVDVNSRNAVPLFLIATQLRQEADGLFPATYVDNTPPLPSPTRHMDLNDRTPPERCKFIILHKDRMILSGSRKFPGRVWRSYPREYEAFDPLDYQDFTRVAGGGVTGLADFNDMVIVFTESTTYALANVDQDEWSPLVVHPGIGCIAPDTIAVGFGLLFWLSKEGYWKWDGVNPPEHISKSMRVFDCSHVIHGRSRGVITEFGYETELIPFDLGVRNWSTAWPAGVYNSLFSKLRYDIRSGEWARITSDMANGTTTQPIATVHWPHYSTYEGRSGALYGRYISGGSSTDLIPFIGAAGNQDDGTDITGTIKVPFGPHDGSRLRPLKWTIHASGVTTPVMVVQGLSYLGYKPSIATTPTTDAASWYSAYKGMFADVGRGSANLELQFQCVSSPPAERQAFIYASMLDTHSQKNSGDL